MLCQARFKRRELGTRCRVLGVTVGVIVARGVLVAVQMVFERTIIVRDECLGTRCLTLRFLKPSTRVCVRQRVVHDFQAFLKDVASGCP